MVRIYRCKITCCVAYYSSGHGRHNARCKPAWYQDRNKSLNIYSVISEFINATVATPKTINITC